jgi:hypothetical protein
VDVRDPSIALLPMSSISADAIWLGRLPQIAPALTSYER